LIVVTQVVTGLPPAVDGIGDYSLNLARELRKEFGIETQFIVGNPNWIGAKDIEGFPVNKVTVHSTASLLSLLPNEAQTRTIVLLHYVGYGYAKRGCPFWLVEGLECWKRNSASTHLVTMFHEVYASGPLWTSAFWLSSVQRHLAVRLVQISDRYLTSKQGYGRILQELAQSKQTQLLTLPVFSTIGEPKQVPPLAQRYRRLVVFGGCSNRIRVYQKSGLELSETCQRLKIEEIWDIGPPTGLGLSTIDGIPVVEMGSQSASNVSDILSNSLAAFFNYHLNYLAKSTIFAAYCAHGILPVSPRSHKLSIDGIIAGRHYWSPVDNTQRFHNLEELQAIANNAYAWYQTHNLSVQAKAFAALLADTSK
jgi:hypothetical protein